MLTDGIQGATYNTMVYGNPIPADLHRHDVNCVIIKGSGNNSGTVCQYINPRSAGLPDGLKATVNVRLPNKSPLSLSDQDLSVIVNVAIGKIRQEAERISSAAR